MYNVMLVVLSFIISVCTSYTLSNYGPFNMSISKFASCNGPKRKDCSVNTETVINDTTLKYDIYLLEDVKDVHGNMFAISESKQVMKLQLKKLCDHPFWLAFAKKFINITDKCVVLKGNYTMTYNAQEIAQKYFGGSFIYGKWAIKTVMYSSDCNFSCTYINIVFRPK